MKTKKVQAASAKQEQKARVAKTQVEKAQVETKTVKAEQVTNAPVWTFLTNHSHVLICLSREPDLRLRDVAERVGITERAVQRIVADLEEAAILTRSRDGRRNRYEVHAGRPLRHAIEAHCTVNDLLQIVETD